MTKHWRVALDVPDVIDRKILQASLLPEGWRLAEVDNVLMLEASDFSECVDATAVYSLATDLVHRLDLAGRLTDPSFLGVKVGHIREVSPSGDHIAVHVHDSATVTGRARIFASTGEPSPAIRDVLAGLATDVLAQVVVELVDDRGKEAQLRWVHLYVAVEVIADELKDHGFDKQKKPDRIGNAGFATRTEIESVMQSAQIHRHGENMGPQKVTLEEASAIMRRTVQAWLSWRAGVQT